LANPIVAVFFSLALTALGIAVSTLRRIEEDKAEGVDFSTLTRLAEFCETTTIDALFQIVDERRALRLVVA